MLDQRKDGLPRRLVGWLARSPWHFYSSRQPLRKLNNRVSHRSLRCGVLCWIIIIFIIIVLIMVIRRRG